MTTTLDAAAPNETPQSSGKIVSPTLQDARDFTDQLAGLSRGQLAQLKRNVGQPLPGRGTAWFYGLLYQGDTRRRIANDEIYFLIATLYDFNRLTTTRGDRLWGSLGRSMRLAADKTASDSVKRRFQILLDADGDTRGNARENLAESELAFRLRQTVKWLGAHNVGFDPAQLITDLSYWSHIDRFVQKRWARDFFVAPAEVRTASPDEANN